MELRIPCTLISEWEDGSKTETAALIHPDKNVISVPKPPGDTPSAFMGVLVRQSVRIGSETYATRENEDRELCAVRTYDVFFARLGYAQVEATSSWGAQKIADETLEYEDISGMMTGEPRMFNCRSKAGGRAMCMERSEQHVQFHLGTRKL